jgi:hypothetical protein
MIPRHSGSEQTGVIAAKPWSGIAGPRSVKIRLLDVARCGTWAADNQAV